MGRLVKWVGLAALVLVPVGAWVAWQSRVTEGEIVALEAHIAAVGQGHPAPRFDPALTPGLPEPVQRYFRFTFKAPAPAYAIVRLTASGEFRRPRSAGFNTTTASQVIAAGEPALMFSATTSLMPGVWARAYDVFADGQMAMKTRILSTLTVVDERQTPQLNQTSLRRWLLESGLYPAALLPGGPVRWEPIDDHSARAVVAWRGLRAAMVAHFADDGQMTHMSAEADGDLDTPYHGAGEHVARSDYRLIGYQMIPMAFTISRMAGGKLYPFWQGSIDDIAYE